MPRALVTGGAGFIGSHVADRLLKEGFDVHVLDDLSAGFRRNLPPQAVFHQLDINTKSASELVEDTAFDVIVHSAAQMDVRASVADPVFDAVSNITGTLNLLEALRRSERKPRFVYTSTGGALYGDFETPPHAETIDKDPASPYGVSKLAVEYYLAYYGRVHGLDYAALRFGNVYGPRQDPRSGAGVIGIFCDRILDGRPLTIFGKGMQTRDYTYVSDIVNAGWLAATRDLPPPGRLDARAFNVGTMVGTTMLDVAALLQRAAGTELPIEFAGTRQGEQQESFVAIDKARRVLGWEPQVSLADGLSATYEWFADDRLTGAIERP
ncbi:MAG: GDP-mannose 4,6-dehydratase [Gemmatimonadaceae bacterium]|nr:GDP-mannose 4,6-dehydratase [Gemmatimonadaceae bacterium]